MQSLRWRLWAIMILLAVGVATYAQQGAYRNGIVCALSNVNVRQYPNINAPVVDVATKGHCYTADWIITSNPTITRQGVEAWVRFYGNGVNAGWGASNYAGTPLLVFTSIPVLYSPTPSRTLTPLVAPSATATRTPFLTPTQETFPDVTLLPTSTRTPLPTPTPFTVCGITPQAGGIFVDTVC